jgi:beta-mannosidase
MRRTTFLHSGWEFIERGAETRQIGTVRPDWLPAQVPGHVHLDLIAAGVIADPFVRMNELGCQWVDRADWVYRTTFEWQPSEGLPRRVLHFEGLDTVCAVFLNDEKVAEHDNMFIPLEIDVTERLREGQNSLRIEFESAVRVGEERKAPYFAEQGIQENVGHFTERSFVRKAQYMSGWDWGPRLVSCGIWRPVSLIEFSARILDVHARVSRKERDLWVVDITSTVEGEGQIVHSLGAGVGCRVGDGTFVLEDPPVWDPELPAMVELLSAVLDPETELDIFEADLDELDDEDREEMIAMQAAFARAAALDLRKQSIGFSEIRLVREPDEFGESFEFVVNGRRLWARGANWIPDHSFPSAIDRARLRDRLEKAVDMGFNMLRVWGGGLYETDEFYELCDELGILVWQDFPFACAYYPDTGDWPDVIAHEAEVNVRRIRNHPSLALWCGNNENHEMYFNQWGGPERTPARYYGQTLYEKTLPAVVAQFDTGRSYIPSSPIGTPPEEKVADAKRRGPNADGYGDQHNWDVWHGRGDWRHYVESKGRFSSEYGFASSCSLSVWSKTLSEEDWDPHSPAVKWHDKTAKGHETFHGFVALHYPKVETLEDWVYYSQLNQRDALRQGVEHYRRSAFCRGSLIWQLNDCWPVQSWAILDSDGNYKALAYELRRLYADRLISLERHNAAVRIHAVNDGDETWETDIDMFAVDIQNGAVLKDWTYEAVVEPDGRTNGLEIDLTGLNVHETAIFVVGAEATPTWMLLNEPKSMRFGPASPLVVSTHAEGVLTFKTGVPLFDLMLTSDGDPSPFADNFVTTPAGTFEIACPKVPETIEARSLAGIHRLTVTRSPI